MSTWINDFKNNAQFANDGSTLPAQSRVASANGAAVDMVEAEGPCFGLLNVGVVTAATLDVKVQESDTSGGVYTDIPGATIVQVTTSNKTLAVNFKRTKRFIRGVGTMTGTSAVYSFTLFGQKKAN